MYGSSEQGGYGDSSLSELINILAGSPIVSAPVIGKLQKVTGSITITRAKTILPQPAVGDHVYEGDLIETGIDGLVAIVFVDGTTFLLYANAHLVLDEFSCGAKENSALFRVQRGLFSFIASKLATAGRLIIDTPVARIQNTRPALGIGSLAFSVFTIGLIHELKAGSADVALIDDGTIDCKDLKHGVFEIITKGDHPQRYLVDNPCELIDFQLVGSQLRVSKLANTPTQMAQFHDDFLSAYDTYLRGQQDPFIRQWQKAEAQPQSTGSVGSSTLLSGQTNFAQLPPESIVGPSAGNSTNGTTTTATTTVSLAVLPGVQLPPITPPITQTTFVWTGNGTFDTLPNWNPGAVPAAPVDTVIIQSGTVTYTNSSNITYSVLTVEPGTTPIINPGSSLTVSTLNLEAGAQIENLGGKLIVDPGTISGTFDNTNGTFEIVSSLTMSAAQFTNTNGTLNLDPGAIVTVSGVTTLTSGIINVNGVFNSTGTTVIDSAAISIASTGTLESTGGTLTINIGSINNTGNLDAGSNSTLIVDSPVTGTGLAMIGANAILEFILVSPPLRPLISPLQPARSRSRIP